MKRILSLILVLAMVIGLLPVTARAGELDNGLVYEVYADHVEITGYTGDATEVVIPAEIEEKPVTSIGERAFGSCRSLITIDLPDSITSIAKGAFSSCSNLTDIDLPDRLTTISDSAFNGCRSLTGIDIPDSVTSIGGHVFSNCWGLTSIVIPGRVTSIGDNAFSYCYDLTSVVLPEGIISIDGHAFYNCGSLASINLPDSITSIGDHAFTYCRKLTDIDLPDSLTFIGEDAFSDCSGLTGIDLPEGLTSISTGAFGGCYGMTSIDLPDNLTTIGSSAFSGCSRVTDLDLPDSVTTIGNYAFSGCSSLTAIDFPDSVTTIGAGAFSRCSSLTSVFIPEGITSIGVGAFSRGSSLTEILVDENNPNYSNDSLGVLFDKEKTTLLQVPGATGDSYVFPECVAAIGDSAFAGCKNLDKIYFNGTAPAFGKNVFEDVYATAYFPGDSSWFAIVSRDQGGHITWVISEDVGLPTPTDPANGMIAPREILSRGMFFYALWNYCGAPAPESTENPFTDLSESDCYYDAVLWAVESGISTGIGPTQFGSDHDVYRAQAVTWLWKALGSPAPSDEFPPYSDVPEDYYYTDAVAWAWAEGYMASPKGNYEFEPNTKCQYGHINWVPTTHTHSFTAIRTENICTAEHCLLHVCPCGYGFTANYEDPLGHNFEAGVCGRCGEIDPDYEAPVEPPFTDVPAGAYYEAPVLWAVENGITAGATENSFNPGGACLRAHVVTFLWRAAKQPEPAISTSAFTDVRSSDFFFKPVLWAVEQKITSGVSATEFGSYANCNRAAVVTFLWRAAGSPEPSSTNNPFTDVKSTDFFYKSVLWAVENGITAGLTATTFGPTAECNRAQVVTFLYRAYN
ncbi:MAG: leucine-rich repeat protein [Oscillospiraceae bacterium]|nr:leucine-rich repeat protein [Oscillospiraceae bacterium]